MATISFDELLPGHVVRVTDDSPPLVWAVDVIMAVTGQTRSNCARTLREIPNNLFSNQKVIRKSFPGSGNSNTPLVAYKDALTLVMVLPGTAAKAIRQKAADILTRYFAGDPTLAREIQANAESQAPINQMARAALQAEAQAVPVEDEHSKKRRRELEDIELDMKKHELLEKRYDMMQKQYENSLRLNKLCMELGEAQGTITQADKDWNKAIIKQYQETILRNTPGSSKTLALGNGVVQEEPPVIIPERQTVASMCISMGVTGLKPEDYKNIGTLVSKKFKARHGFTPADKTEAITYVQGQPGVSSNKYSECDYDILREGITEYTASKDVKEKKARAQPAILGFFTRIEQA